MHAPDGGDEQAEEQHSDHFHNDDHDVLYQVLGDHVTKADLWGGRAGREESLFSSLCTAALATTMQNGTCHR